MAQVHQFIEALKRWQKAARPKVTSYSELVFQLAYDLGCRWDSGAQLQEADDDEYLRMIDEQVYYLVSEQHLSEEFLVVGLIEATARYLHKPLTDKVADIAYLEKMLTEVDEIDTILHKLVQLKDPEFEALVMKELNHWRQIIQDI